LGQPSQVASKFAGKRLLIVDDETDMRLLLAEYFRRLGFQVEERESGSAALEPATSGRFDCFIFDVSMSGMSGFELLPAYAKNEAGVSETAIGIVFFVNTVVIVLTQLPISRRSEGRRRAFLDCWSAAAV